MNTLALNPMLAEIADKMPGICTIWIIYAIVAVVGVAYCRISKWLYLPLVPAACWLAHSGWAEPVADNYFRDAVITELGWGYLIQTVSASVLPLVALLASGVYDLDRWRAKCRSNSGRPHER